MNFKIGDRVHIIIPKDRKEHPQFNLLMEHLAKNQPKHGYTITSISPRDYGNVYELDNNSWKYLAKWLKHVNNKLHSFGGNV